MSSNDQTRVPLTLTLMTACAVGLLLAVVGTWPMFGMVPYRLGGLASDCTVLAFPGIIVALLFGGNVHDYSRAVVFLGNLFFYGVVAAVALTLWFLWSRRHRAS